MWPKLDIMATNTVPYAHCGTLDASFSIACLVSRAHISALQYQTGIITLAGRYTLNTVVPATLVPYGCIQSCSVITDEMSGLSAITRSHRACELPSGNSIADVIMCSDVT